MGETGEAQGQNPDSGKKQERKAYKLKVRGPLFDYIADKLAPVYAGELAALKKDGAYKPLKAFFSSPFGTVMSRILNIIDESPKRAEIVELEMFKDEYEEILKKIPEGGDYLQAKVNRQMISEFKDNFRNSKKA